MKRTLAHFVAATGGRLEGADASFGAVSTDTRTIGAGDLFFALAGPNFDGHEFVAAAAARGAAGAVVSRRVDAPLPQLVVTDTLRALQDTGRTWREQFGFPVVAVAGSNGKTTTKELVASILAERGPCHATRGNLNNHIGVPLTLLEFDVRHAAAVVEIGADREGEVAALMPLVQPDVAIVTNAGAEHLEFFGDLDGVARGEGETYAGLAPGATAILNADDRYADFWRGLNRAARVLTFGMRAGADFTASGLVSRLVDGAFVQAFELRTPAGRVPVRLALAGRHNVTTALGAAAAAYAAGASLEQIAAGLGRARAVKGRLQPKAAANGAWLVDDTYNANPSSLQAALDVVRGLEGDRRLVLGDMAELGAHALDAHRDAGRAAREAGITRLYAVGRLTPHAVETFGDGAEWFPDVQALAARAHAELAPGVVLLVKGSRSNRLERVVDALVAPSARAS